MRTKQLPPLFYRRPACLNGATTQSDRSALQLAFRSAEDIDNWKSRFIRLVRRLTGQIAGRAKTLSAFHRKENRLILVLGA
jgi:hypothetical protein